MTQEVQQVAQEAVAERTSAKEVQQAAPQYLTVEQVQTLLSNQQRAFEGQLTNVVKEVRGIASKTDSGLNAIRRDTQAWAAQQIQLQRKEWLAGMTEEQRAVAEPLLKEIDRVGQPAARTEPEPQADAPAEQPDPWAKVYELVEDYGLKRDAQGIDYAAFTDSGLTDRQRQQRFMGSLRKVAGTSAPVPVAPAAPRTPQPAAPPESPRGGGGGYASEDAARDAYITGKLNTNEYRQIMQSKFGVSV